MPRLITVSQAVGKASMEIGLAQSPPLSVLSSLDQDIAQMGALLSVIADELLLEEPYKTLLGDGNWLFHESEPVADPVADTDTIMFDPRLIIDGLKFRFLAAKGLEFGEELRDYTTRLNKLAARLNRRVLDLETDSGVIQ